jgi:lysophospholipase L1-like esterase
MRMNSSSASSRARILCTGDSITRGNLGRSYVAILAEFFPEVEIVNLGQDGDTLNGIRRRTLERLQNDGEFRVITVAAGHNDIILPALSARSPLHDAVPRSLARRGSIPAADPGDFHRRYGEFIDELRAASPAHIVISTLSSLNESPEGGTAGLRAEYNRIIREIAREKRVGLADVGAAFDEVLSKGPTKNYFLESLIAPLAGDRWGSRTSRSAAELSRRRELRLTIDGVHINQDGARIYAEIFAEQIGRGLEE